MVSTSPEGVNGRNDENNVKEEGERGKGRERMKGGRRRKMRVMCITELNRKRKINDIKPKLELKEENKVKFCE